MANRDKTERIKCHIGGDAPEYYIIRTVKNCLKDNGKNKEAEKFENEASEALNTAEVLKVAEKYVDIV
jgi:benzoyl-CoA reductase/2-hydroxyglutaryl-CoA dehydratase subunit BcrC/BadD/HgdB